MYIINHVLSTAKFLHREQARKLKWNRWRRENETKDFLKAEMMRKELRLSWTMKRMQWKQEKEKNKPWCAAWFIGCEVRKLIITTKAGKSFKESVYIIRCLLKSSQLAMFPQQRLLYYIFLDIATKAVKWKKKITQSQEHKQLLSFNYEWRNRCRSILTEQPSWLNQPQLYESIEICNFIAQIITARRKLIIDSKQSSILFNEKFMTKACWKIDSAWHNHINSLIKLLLYKKKNFKINEAPDKLSLTSSFSDH